MIDLQVLLNISDIEKILNEDAINKAITRSLNRAANAAITAGSKKIREEYNIKAKDIRSATKIKKATFVSNEVVITITGGAIPFRYFSPKQTLKGVTVKIKKGGKRTLVKGAFIGGWTRKKVGGRYSMVQVTKRNGLVFARKGKARYPLKELSVTSVTIDKLFASDKVMSVIQERVNEIVRKEMVRNYEYYRNR